MGQTETTEHWKSDRTATKQTTGTQEAPSGDAHYNDKLLNDTAKCHLQVQVYINLRRSRDCILLCLGGWVFVYIKSLLHSVRFGRLLCCAHKRIVDIIKVYIERNNMQVELIRFRKKYHLYSCLLLRSEEFNATCMFTLGKSLQHQPVR